MTERVRITSPRTAGRRPRPVSGTEEIDAQSPVGEIYMRSLIRSQLRIAIAVMVSIGLGIGGLPLLFWFVPGAVDVSVFGVPLAWLLLGGAVYPLLLVVGWLYVRQAERNERQFSELVERRGDGAASRAARNEHSGERDRKQSEGRTARRARPGSPERRGESPPADRRPGGTPKGRTARRARPGSPERRGDGAASRAARNERSGERDRKRSEGRTARRARRKGREQQ